jgi:hypothetical protein
MKQSILIPNVFYEMKSKIEYFNIHLNNHTLNTITDKIIKDYLANNKIELRSTHH